MDLPSPAGRITLPGSAALYSPSSMFGRPGQAGDISYLYSPQPLNSLNPHAQPGVNSYLTSPQPLDPLNPHAQPGIERHVPLLGHPITSSDWRSPESSGRNLLRRPAPTTAPSSSEANRMGIVSPNIDHLIRSLEPVTPPSPLSSLGYDAPRRSSSSRTGVGRLRGGGGFLQGAERQPTHTPLSLDFKSVAAAATPDPKSCEKRAGLLSPQVRVERKRTDGFID
jgi:hypothetical protein